jgi:hypothetical protein
MYMHCRITQSPHSPLSPAAAGGTPSVAETQPYTTLPVYNMTTLPPTRGLDWSYTIVSWCTTSSQADHEDTTPRRCTSSSSRWHTCLAAHAPGGHRVTQTHQQQQQMARMHACCSETYSQHESVPDTDDVPTQPCHPTTLSPTRDRDWLCITITSMRTSSRIS